MYEDKGGMAKEIRRSLTDYTICFFKVVWTKIVQLAVTPARIIKSFYVLKNTSVAGLKIFIANSSFSLNALFFS